MTRDEFLERLGELLVCLPADQVEETKLFYAEVIADRMEDGMSEDEAVAAMGAPEQVAETVLDELPAVPRAIAKTRRRSDALLWILAIVGSPVWASLLIAFVAVVLSIYVCIWLLALCVWIIAAGFAAGAGAAFMLVPAGMAIGHVPYVLAMLGVGLVFTGGTLLVGVGAWAATKQIACLSALWARKAVSPFWKGRSRKNNLTAATHRAA